MIVSRQIRQDTLPLRQSRSVTTVSSGWTAFLSHPSVGSARRGQSKNRTALVLKYVPRWYDGAFGHVGHEGTTLQILSEEFLDIITTDERERLQLQSVTGKGRARTFYELVGPMGPPLVAVAGMKISGWRCTACDHRTWGYWVEGMSINSFVAKADLPSSLYGVFTVGNPPEVQLAVTAHKMERTGWQEGHARLRKSSARSCPGS